MVINLKKQGYFEMLAYKNMRTAPMVFKKGILEIVKGTTSKSNSNYILNMLSIELFIRYVERLSKKSFSFQKKQS
jgi:hypothetical protein